MNIQAHMSGQISGQVPNQGTMSQQNGNSQMQNLVGGGGGGGAAPVGSGLGPSRGPVDNDILKLRQAMRIKIFNILQQKQPSPADDASKAKYMDVAKRLEEGLFKVSNTKEDYMNQSTLEPRLASIIKGRQLNNYNQQRHANSSSVATMIPTPGLQHSGGNPNMMVTSSVDNDILKLRQVMRIKTYNILQQKLPSAADDASKAKYMDIARRLEEGLFKVANTKEDYMNESTLEPRLGSLIKGRQLNNYTQQRHANSSSVATMIPTPGLQQRNLSTTKRSFSRTEIAEKLKSLRI